jgi:cell wall assembly regulator SMI1
MLVEELRPPVKRSAGFLNRPGAEQLRTLWSLTSGQQPGTLGILGGLCLLGPVESQLESQKWQRLMTSGVGLQAVAQPVWDASRSLDPDAVRAVYFAAGWIPVLSEPLEANYLAVDLVPLPAGRPGQIVLCGRDEDEKCVVAPDLACLLQALAARVQRWCLAIARWESKAAHRTICPTSWRSVADGA